MAPVFFRTCSSLRAELQLIPRIAAAFMMGGCALVLLLMSGCDTLGLGGDESFDVPPERLVAMTAVFEETLEGGRPVHRLVLADVENPSDHEVLSAAGRDAGRSCFGPEKRRLLFEDNSESTVGSRAPIKLLNLETREVRDLNAAGTLKGCVWRADGSGFYYAAGGPAGLTVSTFYDLESGETEIFAQSESGATVIPYGRKGRDSILVLSNERVDSDKVHIPFYFVDAQTGEYLTQIENEHLRFVPWEDPDRGGWRRGAFKPTYNDGKDRIAFLIGGVDISENIAITSLDGNLFELYGKSGDLAPHWGPNGTVLFERRGTGIMILDPQEDEVRELITPGVIDRAVRLANPDY